MSRLRSAETAEDRARVLRDTKMFFHDAGMFFRRMTQEERFDLVRGLERLTHKMALAENRQKGKRRGDLYDLHVELVRAMVDTFMSWKTGALECTYSMMCRKLGRSRATIARLIKDLERHGILEKVRRWDYEKYTDHYGQERHRRVQAPNAYRLNATKAIKAMLVRKRPAPPR